MKKIYYLYIPAIYSYFNLIALFISFIVHKSVQKFLQGQMAGRWVHNDKASKGQQQQQHQQEQQQQVMINGAATADETTMSNLALKVKTWPSQEPSMCSAV